MRIQRRAWERLSVGPNVDLNGFGPFIDPLGFGPDIDRKGGTLRVGPLIDPLG